MKLSQTIETEYASVNPKTQKEILYNNKNVENLLDVLQNWLEKSVSAMAIQLIEFMNKKEKAYVKENVRKIPFTQEDISGLCIEMQKIAQKKIPSINLDRITNAGFFLTELIHIHYQKTKTKSPYILLLEDLPKLDHVGTYLQNAHINIFGSTGDYTGYGMISGSLTIFGNTRSDTGSSMENGLIHVKGNTLDFCGANMHDGIILIDRDAGCNSGQGMQNGYLKIDGNAENNLGYESSGGIIVVNGNCTNEAGYLKNGGTLVVKGNAGITLGREMRKGTIIVEGNTDECAGDFALGGTIIVDGKIKSISSTCRSITNKLKIYEAGKEIR